VLVVGRSQDPAHDGLHAKRAEEVSTYIQAMRGPRLTAAGEIESAGAPGENSRKCLLLVADLLPKRVAQFIMVFHVTASAMQVRNAYLGQFTWILNRQSSQADSIKQLKDCRVRAYPKRQGENGNERKARI
jgi:hypothetical protein